MRVSKSRELPARLKMALNHDGSPHNLQWTDNNQAHRPQPSMPVVRWLRRPLIPVSERERFSRRRRPEASSSRRFGIVVEI